MEKQKQKKKKAKSEDAEEESVEEPAPVDDEIDLDFSELMLKHSTSTPLEEKNDPFEVAVPQHETIQESPVVEANTAAENPSSDLFIEENSLGFINIMTEELPVHEIVPKNEELLQENQIPSAPEVFDENPICVPISTVREEPKIQHPNLMGVQAELLNATFIDISAMKPLTVHELNELYENPYLPAVLAFEDEFVNKELNEEYNYSSHPLYELLVKYQKSRQSLKVNAIDVNELKNGCQKHFSNCWTFQKGTARGEGYCSDRKLCKVSQAYEYSTLNTSVVDQLKNDLKSVLEISGYVYNKNLYTSAVCKLQIESRIRDLLESVPSATQNPDVVLTEHPSVNLQDLRLSLSILFSFLRKPNMDSVVISDVKSWILRLVAVQLRFATWQDHLFLLFHVLRCPVEIGTWAACCIQVPLQHLDPYSNSPYETPAVHHALTVLMALLKPVKRRQEFLGKIKKELIDPVQENLWVLVDSDGEDAGSNVNEGPRENDMVAILNQIPLEKLFSCVTCAIPKDDGYYINFSSVSGHHLLKSIAFAIKLIEMLGQGLKTYENERYRQFCKRLARIIKHVVQYVSEMHEIFLLSKNETEASLRTRIQLEYNYLVLRACFYIYNSQRIGTWQYLSGLPFTFLSKNTLYKLYYAFQTGFNYQIIHDFTTNFVEKCSDPQLIKKFVNNIVEMQSEDLYYLLQVFSSMACSREMYDWDFIQTVTLGLYEIGFVNETSRELSYKSVKDLIAAIATKFPAIISVIVQRLKTDISEVSTFNPYLMKALPLDLWQPTMPDLEVIAAWLLNFSFESIESQTTRIILNRLNWNFTTDGTLFLPYDIHLRTACLICEVATKHVPETIGLSEISITNLVKNQTSRTQFANWCWNMTSRLRLHCMDQGTEVIRNFLRDPSMFLQRIPELDNTAILCQGVSESRPLAVFISLLVSLIGHSVPQICHKGLEHVKLLLNDSRHTIVIRCLELIVPLFLECPESLSSCDKFQTILTQLLNDRTYQKYTKDFVIIQAQKPVLLLLGNMIQHQIINYASYGLPSPTILINIWIDCLTYNSNWVSNPNCVHIIDLISQIAYQFPDAWCLLKSRFVPYFKEIESIKEPQSSGLFSFISGGSSGPFNGLSQPNPATIWFSLMTLELEFELIECQKGIWAEFLRQIYANGTSKGPNLDQILKKVLNLTGSHQFPVSQLVIFKLANLIVASPITHLLFPVLCQQFFALYLARIPIAADDQRFYEVFGVADRFYAVNTALMKKIKKKLQDASDYHKELSVGEQENAHFHNGCVKIFKAYLLWLEETQLNKFTAATIPSSIPEMNKLRAIFQGNRAHWTEFVDSRAVRKHQIDDAGEWAKIIQRNERGMKKSPSGGSNSSSTVNPKMQIAERLESYDKPLDPPALFDIKNNPSLPKSYLGSNAASFFQKNFKDINEHAKKFCDTINEHKQFDQIYLNFVASLYNNVPQTIKKRVSCGGSCSGHATIALQYQESKMDAKIFEKIENNRRQYENILKQEQAVPGVKVVEAITQIFDATDYFANNYCALKNGNLTGKDLKQLEQVRANGIKLFYAMIGYMKEHILACPISEDVCNHCAAKLGVFIQDNHNVEGFKLLETALSRPDLINLIAELFSPTLSPAPFFIEMYRLMIESHFKKCNEHTIFVLFSKFDVATWLQKYKPNGTDVGTLLKLNLRGLECWNQSHLALIQGILRRQLVHIFEYNFPAHCIETIEQVLIELSEHSFNPDVLYDLLTSLYQKADCGAFPSDPSCDTKPVMIKFAMTQNLLSYETINALAANVSNHFHQQRLRHGLHGLYPKHSSYCRTLKSLIGTISFAYVQSCVKTFPSMMIEHLINMLWTTLCQLFTPWIIPYYLNDMPNAAATWIQQLSDNKVMLPWSQKYVEDAKMFLSLYVDVIKFTIESIPQSQIILSHVLHQYEVGFVNAGMQKYIFEPLHVQLLTLPWQLFHPKLHHIDLIHRILQQFLPDCHAFIGGIFIRVDWTSWMRNCSDSDKSMAAILTIFVKISLEPTLSENPEMIRLLNESLQFPWHVVTPQELEPIFDWLILSSDPLMILKIPGKIKGVDIPLLHLLIVVAGFAGESIPTTSKAVINAKKLLYVRMMTRLLRGCGTKYHQLLSGVEGTKAFNAIIADLLTLIENSAKNEPEIDREANITTLFMEILGSLQTQSESTARLSVNAVIRWMLSACPQDISLLSLLCVLNTFKTFSFNVCLLIEQTIFNYLKQTDSSDVLKLTTWKSVVTRMVNFTAVDVPLLIQNDLLLCLHLFLLERLRICDSNGDRIMFLQSVFVHFDKFKATEATEGQWFLNIGLFIDVGMKSLDGAATFMLSLARFLLNDVTQTERWGDGLLGAIGLKRDSVSNSKRILSRCLACLIFSFYVDEATYPDAPKIRTEYRSAIDDLKLQISSKKYSQQREATLEVIKQLERGQEAKEDEQQMGSAAIIRLFYKDHFLETVENAWN
ncbi:ectopic P granules protein 5 homolog [Culicoides brevitarsis]|uniref:ectopic P granules protein 5 homolog n=1 Tax=Culicoides brevitarsis TaxID=469753 RepID=UPI00307B2986